MEYELIQNLSVELKYGVVVDCGSSGSRAHIFRWRQGYAINDIEFVRDEQNGKPLNKHITPGLSSFKDEPDKASDYMDPIMAFISESIPRDRHLDTPIFFLATAGLRLLDDSTQKKILADITRDFRVKYDFPKIKSQVISGSIEGVYSWISINKNRRLGNSSQNFKSYGMVEMGGASVQVTFELNPEVENSILKDLKSNDEISAFNSQQVTLNLDSGNTFKLFSGTFLGLGVNSAREAATDLLVRDYLNITGDVPKKTDFNKLEVRLEDPCLTVGSSEIVSRPTSLLQAQQHPIGNVVKEREETFKVRLGGTGNFLNCMNLLGRMLDIVKNEKLNCQPRTKHCSMSLLATDFIPFSYYPFIGLSEMFFTTSEMINSAGLFNRSNVLHETKRICSTGYNKLLELYSNHGVSREDRILYECFKASWLLSILHDSGFKMPASYDNFRTLDRLDEQEIDWTMGAMIAEIAPGRANFNVLN